MADDHTVTSGLPESNPRDLAAAIIKRPGMYMGGPVTYERATAYIQGLEMALLLQGHDSPLTDEDHRLLRNRDDGQRNLTDELDDIKQLESLLAKVLTALRRGEASLEVARIGR